MKTKCLLCKQYFELSYIIGKTEYKLSCCNSDIYIYFQNLYLLNCVQFFNEDNFIAINYRNFNINGKVFYINLNKELRPEELIDYANRHIENLIFE